MTGSVGEICRWLQKLALDEICSTDGTITSASIVTPFGPAD